jgi:pyrroline-5-carboxylate reductase
MNEPVIGVFGTGHFSSYMIAALRNGGHAGRIILSPYSRQKAEALALKHGCSVAADDTQLLAEADWLLIAVRPEQLDAVLCRLTIAPGHTIISAVAGVPVDEFRRRLGADAPVYRIIPATYIEFMRDGIIPLYPDSPGIKAVFGKAGTVVSFGTDEKFDLTMAGSCVSAWMYRLMASMEDWFLERGFSKEQARLVISHNIAGAAAVAKANPVRDLRDISDEVATEGTYTKLGLDHLRAVNFSEPWQLALGLVQTKLDRARS